MVETTETFPPEENQTQETPSAKTTKEQNWWKIGFFVLVFLLLIVSASFGYFLVSMRQNRPEEPLIPSTTPTIKPTSLIQLTPEEMVEEIKNKLSENFSVKDCDGLKEFSWQREDKYAIKVKGGCVEVYQTEEFEKINDEVGAYLLQNDFIKNSRNSYSYDSYDTGPKFNTLAFENNQIKCLANWRKGFVNPGGVYEVSYYVFYCGLYDQQNDSLSEILPFFETGRGYSLEKMVENYAHGGEWSFPCCGGAYWIAVKENNQWNRIYRGQDIISCEIVDKYQIPKDIYENCFEDNSGTQRF